MTLGSEERSQASQAALEEQAPAGGSVQLPPPSYTSKVTCSFVEGHKPCMLIRWACNNIDLRLKTSEPQDTTALQQFQPAVLPATTFPANQSKAVTIATEPPAWAQAREKVSSPLGVWMMR